MRKTTSAWIALVLTDWPQDGPISEALTLVAGTPKPAPSAILAASLDSLAASVWTRTELPPITVVRTLPPMPALEMASCALAS